MAAENVWQLDDKFFRRQFESGSSILLLDGFDEVASEHERGLVSALVGRFADAYDRCQIVLTSRPKAYAKDAALRGFENVHVAPLTEESIDAFLHRWCKALFPDAPAQAEAHRRELDYALQARSEIRRMATNPVMLTALAVVHWNERRLPEQRADLYESIIRWLARARENRLGRPPAERCVILLQEVALAMHDHPEGRQIEVPRRWAAERISTMGEFSDAGDYRVEEAERFLGEEELDSGIVVRRGDYLRFWHLSFQEFLAARAVGARPEAGQRSLLFTDRKRLFSPEWRETVLLYAGVLHGQGPQKVDKMLESMLEGQSPQATVAESAQRVGLIGAIQRDLASLNYRVRDPRYHQMLTDVMAIFDPSKCQSISFDLRLGAADALGQAGDPRLETDSWVLVGPGECWLGAQGLDPAAEQYDAGAISIESPSHKVSLSAFQVRRFPVTVGEYAKFLADDGYQEQEYWRDGGYGLWKRPEGWDNQVLYPNRPIVGVSWYEASAYCRWTGRGIRLLTEAQWELAARGTEGRLFPWGSALPDPSRLNFAKSAIGHVTPVGLYPLGATPCGIHDLAGNVFEWCLDSFVDYRCPVKKRTGERVGDHQTFRVVRGGCFTSVAHLVRCAFRGRYRPDYRSSSVGFRVCRMEVNARADRE
jgi:formylglycine-generating enzyme required for sulfatase activity